MDDDTPAQYMVGDVFIFDDKERIEANVEETKESFRKEIADSNADLDSVTADIASIKATLYAKFGKVCTPCHVLLLRLWLGFARANEHFILRHSAPLPDD